MKKHNRKQPSYWWIGLYLAVCVMIVVVARVFVSVPQSVHDGEHIAAATSTNATNSVAGTVEESSEAAHDYARGNQEFIRLLFFGDVMLDRNVKALMERNGGVGYLFERWRLPPFWQDADMMMANMEGAVTADGGHYPPQAGIDFAFDARDVAQLKFYGFDAFTVANNHILDQGRAGFSETQVRLDELAYTYTGCPDRQIDVCSTATTTLQGIEIGLAGYSMVYGLLDKEAMTKQVRALASSTDFTIVNMHWGVEYEQHHNATQQRFAHALADAGADLIIGHHPHVVQDMEIYDGVPIFYSLGNVIFDQYFSKETQEGLGVGVVLQRDGTDVVIDRIDFLPYQSVRSQVELLEGEEREDWVEWFQGL